MSQDGFVVWLTGWSGSGKSTIAFELKSKLQERGVPYVQILDGDLVRQNLTRDLGFSREDRNENIQRVSFVAGLLSKNGVAVIASFISPYREARREARRKCHNFIEVYVKCSKEELIKRDVKGLYARALNGEISNFTGINDPYEEPPAPEMVVETDRETVDKSAAKIMQFLDRKQLVSHV